MAHRDGFPGLSAGSVGRGDAGHHKPWAPPQKHCAVRKPRPTGLGETAVPVARANRRRTANWAPDRTALASCPAMATAKCPESR